MISILIPVFNKDINELVNALNSQLFSLTTKAEIIIFDDASDIYFRNINQKLSVLPLVTYRELPQNVGRSRIRQILAETAIFEWLLFLDCDSKIINDHFLLSYQQSISDITHVIIGGRQYVSSIPNECRFRLHWKYGTVRETAYQKAKRTKPYFGFMSNNFLIQKEIFRQIVFLDDLKGYGHEDTWIGIQLERLKANITFLNNPVLHDGLENVENFMRKSQSAVKNLNMLSAIVRVDILKKHVKLFRYYMLVRRLGLNGLITRFYSYLEPYILKNIYSCKPSLFLFDLYRLNLLIRFSTK